MISARKAKHGFRIKLHRPHLGRNSATRLRKNLPVRKTLRATRSILTDNNNPVDESLIPCRIVNSVLINEARNRRGKPGITRLYFL